VFFGRFVAFLRVFAALLAGVNKYRWLPFLFFNAAGGILWAVVFGVGAFFFGESIHRVTGPLGVAALAGVVMGAIAFMYVARRGERRMEKKLSTKEVDSHAHLKPGPPASAAAAKQGHSADWARFADPER
jgi:membrane protein DedA with SNARE-associated domain